MAADELHELPGSGLKPLKLMQDGEDGEVSSMTSSAVYRIRRHFDHYSCTCPAWRNQGGMPVNARTCKHLKGHLGEAYEKARLEWKNPDGNKATAKKAPSKRKKRDDEDDEDDKPAKRAKGQEKKADDDEDEDNDNIPATKGKAKPPDVLLAGKWDLETGIDPTGWWISEKLDSVRTFYDGKSMISRLGNPFTPPQWFLEKLPKDVTLDGELFGGRRNFQDTVSIVKTINSPHWKNITFKVFDIPSRASEPFEARLEFLQKLFGAESHSKIDHVEVVEHTEAKGRQHVLDLLKDVEAKGGEGLMLRKPGSLYEGKRSSTLLKVKTFYDGEAVVQGYVPGKGKNKGKAGALKCAMESGKKFNVGTGLSDKQRANPPKVGAIITYRFQELTRDGVPRFPSFIGEAIDKKKPKDAEVPEHRKAGYAGPNDV